ncbi:MAG: tRNA (adenosine(37)-N6)-threonylcarbamoyltransferase complex dimerization subunit type 1 TsaB [Desulfobulbus sp.]|nr:MAG: tRNA (adenosine(37)-N6)-threonylcarbamoyltransferase complex dimerization subunit type 1 TsaB [Desulfobulbus sp.]
MAGSLLILSIETSTGCGSVSLTRGGCDSGHLLAEATAHPEVTHSRRLLGSVDWVMKAAGVEWPDIDGVAVSLGPGSFTGLRIGMAAAKGIVLAAGIPLLGVSTFAGIALSCGVIDRPLWCVLDARKQEVYAACFLPGKNRRPELSLEAVAIKPEALVRKMTSPSLLAGPGVDAYRDIFAAGHDIELIPAALSSPRAAQIGYLAAELLAADTLLDPAVAVPAYVRASDAEINLVRKKL